MKKDRFKILEVLHKDELFPIKRSSKELPNKLYFKGKIDNSNIKIAIVGTRKANKESIRYSKEIARELAKRDIAIISGLAFGIDSAAHEGAIEAGGTTWAVLAHGLDRIYPVSHTNLANSILENGGALISEYNTKSIIYKTNFLERNKIISAISDAILVIEAPIKSGSISTASFALKSGTPVFALPGSVSSQQFAGSNILIRKGARLITRWEDIMNDLNIKIDKVSKKINTNLQGLTENQKKIIKAIITQKEPITVDKIAETIKLDVQTVSSNIIELQINNIVENIGNKYIIK